MGTVDKYRTIIRRILSDLSELPGSSANVKFTPVFDGERDVYMVVSQGWDGLRRVNHIVSQIEIIEEKIWVQSDNTNVGIVRELEEAGVPKHDIVLGFRHPDVRPLTEYAVA